MAEDLLEKTLNSPANRPDDIPEKFWDAEANTVRVDALLKSYRELERHLSSRPGIPGEDANAEERARFLRAMGVPETPDAYKVEARHPLLESDTLVNQRLHEAGFTPTQVQLVYDLASEHLLPLIADVAQQFEADRQIEILSAHFGGEKRFRTIATQIDAWGRAHLPEAVFEALCTTSEGVIALENMMRKGEPAVMKSAAAPKDASESELRAMVRDPRYWKAKDPAFIDRVSEGFRSLFANK